jgi:hypothetical protein
MEVTDGVIKLFQEATKVLKGSERRLFMARTVKELGKGGQRRAQDLLGWDRTTIRKGMHELESGIICVDAFNARGRKRAEEHLPNLLVDLKAIVDSQSQVDPQFRTNRLYTRLDGAEVHGQLIEQKGYQEEELPSVKTIVNKLNILGYYPQRVEKSQPQKNRRN